MKLSKIVNFYVDAFKGGRNFGSTFANTLTSNLDLYGDQKRAANGLLGAGAGVGLGYLSLSTLQAATFGTVAAVAALTAAPVAALVAVALAPVWLYFGAVGGGASLGFLNSARKSLTSFLPADVRNTASDITAQAKDIAAQVTAPVSKLAKNKTLSTKFGNAIAAPKAVAAKLTPKLHLPHIPKF